MASKFMQCVQGMYLEFVYQTAIECTGLSPTLSPFLKRPVDKGILSMPRKLRGLFTR